MAVKSSVERSRAQFLRTITEVAFQHEVIKMARQLGWLTYHFRPAFEPQRQRWRTPVEGDSGWVDLILIRHERILFRELKSETGKLRPDQEACIAGLKLAGQDVAVWRPRDMAQIRAELAVHNLNNSGKTGGQG